MDRQSRLCLILRCLYSFIDAEHDIMLTRSLTLQYRAVHVCLCRGLACLWRPHEGFSHPAMTGGTVGDSA